jgi:uncharacterized lipoprotein YbaY
LPALENFPEGAVAVVGLDDVTQIDAPSNRIAETMVSSISGPRDRIPFTLTVEERSIDRGSYVLSAEVRRDGTSGLRPGDFLSTVAHPWRTRESESSDQIVRVSRI